MSKPTKQTKHPVQKELSVGDKITIPTGTKINTGDGQIKADRDFQVTVYEVQKTRAGNTKVYWRGHRAYKSAVLK